MSTVLSQSAADVAEKLKQQKKNKQNQTLGILNACLDLSQTTVQLSPAPAGCQLEPNTTYTWCVSINKYNQPNSNWISGIVPVLGCVWDSTTIQPIGQLATADGGSGTWVWTHGVTGQQTGAYSASWGWYFDRNNDGNPGNNYGDNATCCWNFCFTVKTISLATANTTRPECLSVYNSGNSALDGSIKIKVLSDEQIGSWNGNGACFGDSPAPTTGCSPSLNLCPTLSVNKTDAKCSAPNGTAWINFPANYTARENFNFLWFSNPPQTGDTAFDLFPGTYQVIGSSTTGCNYNFTVTIGDNYFSVSDSSRKTLCFGDSTGIAWVLLPTSGGPYGVSWQSYSTINDTLSGIPAGEYIYTVTDSSTGCLITDTITVYSPEIITVFYTTDTSRCLQNNGSILVDVSGGSGTYQYLWKDPNGAIINPVTPTNPVNLSGGIYSLTVTDTNNCKKTFSFNVPYTVPPSANFLPSPTSEFISDSAYTFVDNSSAGSGTITQWWWTIEGNTSNPITTPVVMGYSFPDSGNYEIKLIVKNSAGCYDTTTAMYQVKKRFYELYFPNIFTPNADGQNDYLVFKNLTQYPQNEVYIYNRWGNKVFEQKNYQNNWEAKELENGTYFYIVKIPNIKNYEGFITIIR
jgi:gliding motility-associated-like protein